MSVEMDVAEGRETEALDAICRTKSMALGMVLYTVVDLHQPPTDQEQPAHDHEGQPRHR